jgi:cobyrinic acid a,c-diamide synthase
VGLVRIGRFCDSAFTFYYPENLEALEAAGAELVQVSALEDERLPDVDLLYLGGGFPETHAGLLASNRPLLSAVREAAARGLPIYAECGGLIYLSRSVTYRGDRHELAGVFDIDVEVCPRPQGHGYVSAVVDGPNAFFDEGVSLRGHEFHYSKVVSAELPPTALRVERGKGNAGRRDGLVSQNVLASWIHLHALGAPGWAPALVGAAARWKRRASSVPCAAPAQGHRAPCC